jgi:hypothetical protein
MVDFDPPKKDTFWWYSGRPFQIWMLVKITDEYIFQTEDRLNEKKVKRNEFGKGWQQRRRWDDFPPTKQPAAASPYCSIL